MLSESSETSGSNWYVVQTKPNAWQVAVRNLVRQGFEVFVPLLEHRQRLRQKVRLVHNPAFQGYIFVQFDPETSPWRAINSTFGVSRLVAFGGGVVPTMVPPPFIRALHARCDKDGILNGQENLRPGDKVRIADGPFADAIACVTKLGTQERIWVLMEVLGRKTVVQMPANSLVPVAA